MARRPVKNCKCYTLSALAASLALSAAVSTVLVQMSPAHIIFSITKATRGTSSGGGGGLELSVTLAANNTSRRVWVLYRSINVVFCNNYNYDNNNTDGGGREVDAAVAAAACIGTEAAPMPLRQKPGSAEAIHAAVVLERAGSPWVSLGIMPSQESFIGNKSFDNVMVNVSALVRFKRPGIPWTSLRDIHVSCKPVTWISQANQSSAWHRGALLCHS